MISPLQVQTPNTGVLFGKRRSKKAEEPMAKLTLRQKVRAGTRDNYGLFLTAVNTPAQSELIRSNSDIWFGSPGVTKVLAWAALVGSPLMAVALARLGIRQEAREEAKRQAEEAKKPYDQEAEKNE